MAKSEFVECFGGIYENSPWVAERAAENRPFRDVGHLAAALREAVDSAGAERWLALVRAHPELAGELGLADELSGASRREQQGAGLDRLGAAEFAEFSNLNSAYREKFGFPFVICVGRSDKTAILAAFRRRLANDPAEEISTAIGEIHAIAGLRLADLEKKGLR